MPPIPKRCSKCGIVKRLVSEFYFNRYHNSYSSHCKECHKKLTSAWNSNNKHKLKEYTLRQRRRAVEDPRYRLWLSSYTRACIKGLEHTIKVDDIPLPKTCALLGFQLDYRIGGRRGKNRIAPNAASIDRIDNSKGYVAGNIQVISWQANRMKQDATPEELIKFAYGLLAMFG